MVTGIDPGPTRSAIVTIDTGGGKDAAGGWILENEELLAVLFRSTREHVAIEMIASYGMPVGAEVFETCCWIGRFEQVIATPPGKMPTRIFRRAVKLELCGNVRAKDPNVRQALIDLYGPGKDKAIGLKASPGPLYGFKADMWAALGVAVTYERQLARGQDGAT